MIECRLTGGMALMLGRKDTKTLYLRNSTQLPVAWRLSGLENLGDDFTVAADSGVVEPLSEFPLQAYFRATKPVQTSKRMIRLEVSHWLAGHQRGAGCCSGWTTLCGFRCLSDRLAGWLVGWLVADWLTGWLVG